MNFADAVQSVFRQYANFTGRARRSEYWWFALFSVIIAVIVDVIDLAIKSGILGIVVELALLLPSLAVLARRLHDTDRSGWWILIGLIPIVGAILLIVWACQDSLPGANVHGPSPKYPGGNYPPGGGYPGYPQPGTFPPPQQGYPGYPPQQGNQGYPPPQQGYPGYPPQQGNQGYPPPQGNQGYPPPPPGY